VAEYEGIKYEAEVQAYHVKEGFYAFGSALQPVFA